MDEIEELLAKYPKEAAKYDPAPYFLQLASADAAVRLRAARWLAKQAHGEVHGFTQYWLKDPTTVARVLPCLNDADPLVVEELVGALNVMASPRYGNRNDAVIPQAIELLKSDRHNTRIRSAMLLMNFEDESLETPLRALFADPKKEVRSVVISEIRGPALRWSPAAQERLRLHALEALSDRAVEVRCAAAKLLASVGKSADIATMKQGLKDVKGANWRQDYKESIWVLEQNLQPSKKH
jgi:HEAT repeat protein